jgi:hypothetical protein
MDRRPRYIRKAGKGQGRHVSLAAPALQHGFRRLSQVGDRQWAGPIEVALAPLLPFSLRLL